MGEMYEYFEDFPEENPGNYVGNRFDPEGAKSLRAGKKKLEQEQAKLNSEISDLIRKHSKPSSNVKK